MGLLKKLFQKLAQKSGKSQDDVCYSVAYFLLPQLIFQEWETFAPKLADERETIGAFLYFVACKHQSIEPQSEIMAQFATQRHQLDDGTTCYLFLFPAPRTHGVYPYLSALLYHPDTDKKQYYVLGQTPFSGGTTLRMVSQGINANLGPGPEPTPEAFLEVLSRSKSQDENIVE
jgi:hypothetical protein